MIKKNKMSLTKKLDGGYIHVKKSPIKSTVKSNSGGYSDYLNKNRSSGSNKKKNSNHSKVVAVKLSPSKKRKSPKKNNRVKDIPDIIPKKSGKQPEKQYDKQQAEKQYDKQQAGKQSDKLQQEKKSDKQHAEKHPAKQEHEKQLVKKKHDRQKSIPLQNVKVKGSLKKHQVSNRRIDSKSKKVNKSLNKRRINDSKRGKKISVSKTRKYSEKDISMIQKKIKEIKKKTDKQIKNELENQGVKLSGKSPSLMKDIYMYSQLCGINIKRE